MTGRQREDTGQQGGEIEDEREDTGYLCVECDMRGRGKGPCKKGGLGYRHGDTGNTEGKLENVEAVHLSGASAERAGDIRPPEAALECTHDSMYV